MSGEVWDAGLQPERTSLAWQRVNLAGLGASLVGARLVIETHPLIGYLLAVSAVGAAAMVVVLHRRRLHATTSALRAGRRLPDARAHLVPVFLLSVVAVGGIILLTG